MTITRPNPRKRKGGRRKTVLTEGMHRGMRKGMDAIPYGKYVEVKDRLLELCGGSRMRVNRMIAGTTITHPDKSRAIEDIFAEYGVTPGDIWDN